METIGQPEQIEAQFIQDVVGGVRNLAERHSGQLVVLFDIDETLVLGSHQGRCCMRAGFEPLVQVLKQQYDNRIDFGVLTMWSREECNPESEKYDPIIDPVVAVTSSEFMGYATFEELATDGLFNFQTQEFEWEYTHIREHEFGAWTRTHLPPKLILLDRMMVQHKDTGFVVVEDLPWVQRLQGMHDRVEGVYVGPTS